MPTNEVRDIRELPAAERPQTPEAFALWGELMLRDRILQQQADREIARTRQQPELPL